MISSFLVHPMAKLSPDILLSKALHAGFGPGVAVQMVAIALRESGGETSAKFVGPVDDSYGLLQINMLGSLGVQRMKAFGLKTAAELLDADTNFRCGFQIYARQPRNLAIAWAIDRGIYAARYQVLMAPALKAFYKFQGADPTKATDQKTLLTESLVSAAVGAFPPPDWLSHLFDEAHRGAL